MKPYEMKHLIIDDMLHGQESITADFTYQDQEYSITFNKSDLEVINTWVFHNGTSLPTDLPNAIIESLKEEIEKEI